MKVANNLNQLLSRVKTIFGRKATSAANSPLEAEPPTGIASVSDPPSPQSSLRRHREISRRQLRYTGSQTALSGLHQWSHSYIRRCNVCCIARNPNSHKRSCTSPRQRVAARRSHLDQRCRMARRRAEKVHQLPHEALPQASHPAPRFRLLQRQA